MSEQESLEVRFKKAAERLNYLHDVNELFVKPGRASTYFGRMDQLDADRRGARVHFDALCAELGRRTAGIDHYKGDGHEHPDNDPAVANTTAWWDALDLHRTSPPGSA